MRLIDLLNRFSKQQQVEELRKTRPLHEWPSDLLVWLFWSEEIDPYDRIAEMIHAEMNARGEGEKVAV